MTPFFASNEINRYSAGTKNKDMKLNADGCVMIYVQTDAPAERTNWPPAAAEKSPDCP